MKYLFPLHLDGGNRGCEGIAKGSAKLLDTNIENVYGYTRNIELDRFLNLDRSLTLIPKQISRWNQFLIKFISKIINISNLTEFRYRCAYHYFFSKIKKGDIVLSTGGDMLCYKNNEVIYLNNYCYNNNIKSILWGCSMSEENLTPEKLDTLRKFSFIYARESCSYDFFKSLGLEKVVCYPDPAFILEPEMINLPPIFHNSDVLGLNISNYVLDGFDLNSEKGINLKEFIKYVLNNTNLSILLIPHVMWKNQDDRELAKNIIHEFAGLDRIACLNSEDLNYLQIRYIISKCRYFIGARTHAMISAYSTMVPSIALGYSIKSKGILKDLGLSEELLLDCKIKFKASDYIDAFNYLVNHEFDIREHYSKVLPSYRAKLYDFKKEIKMMCNGSF